MSSAPTHSPDPSTIVLFSMDIVFCASLTNCYLVTTYSSDRPYAFRISDVSFRFDERPHYLIIVFPSCTLQAFLLDDVFLTRRTLRVPQTFRPSDMSGTKFRRL